MRPRLPLLLLVGAVLTSGLWLLVSQGTVPDRVYTNPVGVSARLEKPSLLAVVGVQVRALACIFPWWAAVVTNVLVQQCIIMPVQSVELQLAVPTGKGQVGH